MEIEKRRQRIRIIKLRRQIFNRVLFVGSVVCMSALLGAYYSSRDHLINTKLTAEGEFIKGVVVEKWTSGSSPEKYSVKYKYVIDNKRYVQKSQVFANDYELLNEGDSCTVWYARTKPVVSLVQLP